MSGESQPTNDTRDYDAIRRQRADRPAGGNFVGARDIEGRSIDVRVIGVETRPGYVAVGTPPGTPLPPRDLYWQVEVVRGRRADGKPIPVPVLIKENAFMSDWLEEHNVPDPIGRRFALISESYKGNPRFGIDREI